MERDAKTRKHFEKWAKEGTRPAMYDLTQTISGEYLSPFTEYAWRAFRAGWNAR